MKSIFDNPAAFAPFYDETVSAEMKRRTDGSVVVSKFPVRACVVDDGYSDPISDGDVATVVRRVQVLVRVSDWPDEVGPRVGVRIEREDGSICDAEAVNRDGDTWKMSCREVSR